MNAALKWHFGPMNAGKSTLALQLDFNLAQCGRTGIRFTCLDRAGNAVISSRLGIEAHAREVHPNLDLAAAVRAALDGGESISYVIADEVQFYSVEQVEQLADIVDDLGIEVAAFGLATDFRSVMFPASQRMFEIADEHINLPVHARCWCGDVARMNARVVNGEMVTEGATVVVGDVSDADVHYVLLCRPHFRAGQHDAPRAAATFTHAVA
jgi:thymidine kinase